jgi:hypothetical protein
MHTNRLRDLEILDSQFTGMHRQCKPLGDKSNNLEAIEIVSGCTGFDEELIRKYLPLPDPEETKLREKRPQPAGISSR